MPTRIDKLTPGQIARFPEWIDKWTRIGLSTEPADFDSAERGVRGCYAAAKLAEPKIVVRTLSPLGCVLAGPITASILKTPASVGASVWASVWDSVWDSVRDSVGTSVRDSVRASVRASVGASVWDSVRDSVGASVRDSVGASVRDSVGASVRDSVGASVRDSVRDSVRASVGASVRDSVGASVWDSVWASVWDSVGASVRASVGASVGDSVGASVRDSVGASVWDSVWASVRIGNFAADWYAWISYLRDVCELENPAWERFAHDELEAKSATWVWYHADVASIADRPAELRRDDSGRLSAADGPAMLYRDGWALWFLSGVRVDEQIVMRPETQKIAQIRSEQNEEVKRIRIARYAGAKLPEAEGWKRYFMDTGAKMIDRRANDIENTKEALVQTPDGLTSLVCACPSTGKVFSLEVPKEIKTTEQAQNWLWSGGRHVAGIRKPLKIIGRS
jgi:hypothetical protein